MRYFLELAYNGTRLNGWQIQPNAPSVQEHIEVALSTILREKIEIVGCGRTDAGVHAQYYVAHFDANAPLPDNLLFRLNGMVGQDISLYKISPVPDDAHARFDALSRSYAYRIIFNKNPFQQETAWLFTQNQQLDYEKMHAAAALLRGYDAFAPFCKTHSDALTMRCILSQSEWSFEANGAIYRISANRFLRGMVRLIVGACINIGLGQMTLDDLRQALDTQTMLKKSYTVPPTGLFLTDVQYAYFERSTTGQLIF